MNTKHNLGAKLKSLRRERGLTQEELAEVLGVSFQAVSKWETNAAAPDISLFSVLANYYGVTTDELLGVDVTRAAEKVREYVAAIRALVKKYQMDEAITLARQALHELPGNADLMMALAVPLAHAGKFDEAITLYSKVIEKSADTNQRVAAAAEMAFSHYHNSDKAAALEVVETLPDNISYTRQYMLGRLDLLDSDKQVEQQRENIRLYCDSIAEVAESMQLPDAEKIEVLKQSILIQGIVYGDAPCDGHYKIFEQHMRIAWCHLRLGDNSAALDYLETAFGYAEKYMAYTDGEKYASVILSGLKMYEHTLWSDSSFDVMRTEFAQPGLREKYDPLCADPRFTAIVARLNAYERQ